MVLAVMITCLAALALTPVVRTAALRLGVVDRPNHRKIHTRPIALLGGAAVLASVAVVVLGVFRARDASIVLAGGLLFLVIGLVDDVRALGTSKLVAEFVGAWLVVEVTGAQFHLPWPGAGTALTVLWIVGVVNAFNCIDCADGVAASAGLAAGLAFAAIASLTNQRLEMLLAAAVAGACLGFLPYNFSPARIFLGDAGSLTLGYLVAMIGVMLSPGVLSIPAMATPAVVLAIPIYDIIFVHVRRYRTGQRSLRGLLTSTGKDHLPHRLLGRGLSPRAVSGMILFGSVVSGVIGVALATVNTLFGALATGLAVLIALILLEREWVGMERSGTPVTPPGLQSSEGP